MIIERRKKKKTRRRSGRHVRNRCTRVRFKPTEIQIGRTVGLAREARLRVERASRPRRNFDAIVSRRRFYNGFYVPCNNNARNRALKERGGRTSARARARPQRCEFYGTERRRRLSRELSTPVGFIHRFAPVTGSVSMKA